MKRFLCLAMMALGIIGNAFAQQLQFGFRPIATGAPQQFQPRQGFAAPQQQQNRPIAQNQFGRQFSPQVSQQQRRPNQQRFQPRQQQNFAPNQNNFPQQRPVQQQRANNNQPLFRNNVGPAIQPARQVQQQAVAPQFIPQQNFRNVAPPQQQQQPIQNVPLQARAPILNNAAFVPLVTQQPVVQQFAPQQFQPSQPVVTQQPIVQIPAPQQFQPSQPQPLVINNALPPTTPVQQPAPPAPVAAPVQQPAPIRPEAAPFSVQLPGPIVPISNQIVQTPLPTASTTTIAVNNVSPALTTRQPIRPVPLFPLALTGNNVEANAGVLPLQSETTNLELQFPKYPPFLN